MDLDESLPENEASMDTVIPSRADAIYLNLEPDENIDAHDVNSILDNSDVDSALGDSETWPSSTASLRSSIVRAREENGRIYHGYKDGKGTGEEHPESEVIGVDLSPVQPGFTPPNVHYEIDDLEEEWSFSRNFDYIHSMMMTGAFRDWPNFYRQAFENLNSGGWVECQDINFPMKCDDDTIPPQSDLGRWNELMMEAGTLSGFRLDLCDRAAEMMSAAGFVDIVRIPYKWPINQWPKDVRYKTLGEWTEANFVFGLESIMLALFTRFLGWKKEEVWEFIARVIAEWRDLRNHGYFEIYVTYGRKP
ncbi:methyltransferase tdiE like protein [Verticillium longisporum]|uniref:Methyltransferase tdiE like protein n=1 Tax=Verticillium longisporum TaxID=100787 RepID=A0A8I2ZFK9_VERLO|nr:methyltransferase tdiE like protein [Verticillium longisporum]